jgi:hypothetical protein
MLRRAQALRKVLARQQSARSRAIVTSHCPRAGK